MKRTVKRLLAKCGYDIHPLRPPALQQSFINLKAVGFRPKVIVDIGANRGNWTRISSSAFPEAKFVMIEPQDRLKVYSDDLLSGPDGHRFSWVNAGIGDVNGEFMLTLTERDDRCSFRFTEQEASNMGRSQIKVPILTLDSLAASHDLSPDLVKIDAEGLDCEVLQGGTRVLQNCEVVYTECAMVLDSMTNTLQRIASMMNERGFVAADITDFNRASANGFLKLIEVMFVRKGGLVHTASLGK